MRFYLGTHHPNWLWDERFGRHGIALFVSHNQLRHRKSPFPPAQTAFAIDSGAFSQIDQHGAWTLSPEAYIDHVRRYQCELDPDGRLLEWVSPQDWMCEPQMLTATGLTVRIHQHLTVDNYLHLTEVAPDLPFVPVLQGQTVADYLAHVDLYARQGVDLASLPLVGVGSVCKRQDTDEITQVFSALVDAGISPHGYGVKTGGLDRYAPLLASADSLAWSYAARKRDLRLPGCTSHANCANCVRWAVLWRHRHIKPYLNGQLTMSDT